MIMPRIVLFDGERAVMAHARFRDDVIASSNFRDVAAYCDANNIDLLGTLDILAIARKKGILTETECDNFILEAKVKNKANVWFMAKVWKCF
jgi:hypothetical protein